VGESYAGLLPISSDPNDENKLFFWFFPSTNEAADKEILIWLNGGVSFSSSQKYIYFVTAWLTPILAWLLGL
jgi:carboxypeptidase C (cathepsin A)